MTSASRGVPVTSTARLNTSDTSIVSSRSKVSPTAGEPIDSAVTPGGLPSTLWPALFDIELAPSPSDAAAAPGRTSLMAPPFSVSALAPMLMPSASISAAATAYRNTSVSALLDADT